MKLLLIIFGAAVLLSASINSLQLSDELELVTEKLKALEMRLDQQQR